MPENAELEDPDISSGKIGRNEALPPTDTMWMTVRIMTHDGLFAEGFIAVDDQYAPGILIVQGMDILDKVVRELYDDEDVDAAEAFIQKIMEEGEEDAAV